MTNKEKLRLDLFLKSLIKKKMLVDLSDTEILAVVPLMEILAEWKKLAREINNESED